MSKKEKDLKSLVKKCIGTEPPSWLLPDFQRVWVTRRVDLFPPDYGLSKRGKPDGGFYTLVNDPKLAQKFFTAVSKIFYPMEAPSIIADLFPKECYAQLSFLTDENWVPLEDQTRIKLTGPSKIYVNEYLMRNEYSWKDLKGCHSKKGITRVGINLLRMDSSGTYVSGHSLSLIFAPGKKVMVTVIDPGSLETKKGTKVIIKRIAEELKIDKYEMRDSSVEKSCKRSFQGQAELCATWSLFLIMTEMINPPSWWPRIEKEILEMSEEESGRLIYQFAWWFIQVFGDVVYEGSLEKKTYEEIIKTTQVTRPIRVPPVAF